MNAIIKYLMKVTLKEIAKINERGNVTIPRILRNKYFLKPGTEIAFIEEEGKLVIVPIKDLEELRKDMPSLSEIARELEISHDQDVELEKD